MFLLYVINIMLTIKSFFKLGQNFCMNKDDLLRKTKCMVTCRVGEGRKFLLAFYPQRAVSACCALRILCEYGLHTNWNKFQDNVGSSRKKSTF